MDYNALGLANDISDNHKQSYVNVKDQEVFRISFCCEQFENQ